MKRVIKEKERLEERDGEGNKGKRKSRRRDGEGNKGKRKRKKKGMGRVIKEKGREGRKVWEG